MIILLHKSSLVVILQQRTPLTNVFKKIEFLLVIAWLRVQLTINLTSGN